MDFIKYRFAKISFLIVLLCFSFFHNSFAFETEPPKKANFSGEYDNKDVFSPKFPDKYDEDDEIIESDSGSISRKKWVTITDDAKKNKTQINTVVTLYIITEAFFKRNLKRANINVSNKQKLKEIIPPIIYDIPKLPPDVIGVSLKNYSNPEILKKNNVEDQVLAPL